MLAPDEIFVFLGPTLSLEEAKLHLDARYFPPAKQGDILSLVAQFQPKVVALIDGYFMQNLSVWHKEILYALDRGVIVLGASSMGALRAAETADFGMIGIGKVYELYRSGVVNDDDEVALAHAPGEQGYLPLSIPLINIRCSLLRSKEIEQSVGAAIFEAARSLYYPDRTIEAIAKTGGFSENQVKEWFRTQYVDQKKEDALLLLDTIKQGSWQKNPKEEHFFTSSLFQTLYNYDRRAYAFNTSLTHRQIAQYVALHHPDFSDLQFHALNQALVSFLAKLLRIEVSKEEIQSEKRRFCLHHQMLIIGDEEWSEWLKQNHLSHDEFDALMEERAKARKLHLSYTEAQIPWRQSKCLLDALKLRNRYEEWFKKAAADQQFLDEHHPFYAETAHAEVYGEDLVEEHLNETGWRPDCAYPEWAEEAGFQNVSELKSEIHKAKCAREKNSCQQ